MFLLGFIAGLVWAVIAEDLASRWVKKLFLIERGDGQKTTHKF